MKSTIFTCLFLISSLLNAQNFPVSYEIKRSYQECSQCKVKTRSDWSLVNPNSYSAKIRAAIEDKIFYEKSYLEQVGYYFSEQDYDKECEVSRSGKHVWQDKVSYPKDNMSKDYYLDYYTKEANRTEKLRNEEEAARLAKEKEKKKYEEYKVEYEKLFTNLDKKRKEASSLLEKNEIESYLVLQELNCITWKNLDSIYQNNYRSWDYYDIKTTMKINYRDYWLDVNDFAAQALLSKRFDKLRKATNILIKNGDDFRDWYERYGMTIARYSSHGSLLSNNRSWFWFTQSVVKQSYDQQKKEKWCKLMIDDYNKFEELGILQNVDTLKFILKAWSKQLTISASPSSSNGLKGFIEKHLGYSTGINDFFGAVNENMEIDGGSEFYRVKEKVVSLDKNLYKVDYPQIFNGSWTNYISLYFYLNQDGNLFVVNKSNIDLSDKKLAKIIAKSKEIRDIDLGIISPK